MFLPSQELLDAFRREIQVTRMNMPGLCAETACRMARENLHKKFEGTLMFYTDNILDNEWVV